MINAMYDMLTPPPPLPSLRAWCNQYTCLAGANPTCAVTALYGCEGIWSDRLRPRPCMKILSTPRPRSWCCSPHPCHDQKCLNHILRVALTLKTKYWMLTLVWIPHVPFVRSIDRSIAQSINQSIIQSINRSIDSIYHSINQSINQSIDQ